MVNEDEVRDRARALGDALVAGDVDTAIGYLSDELRRNLGEVVALLPLPAREVHLESVDRTASGYAVVLELVGSTDRTRVQTRWKDRDGEPTIVEVSHLSHADLAAGIGPGEGQPDGTADGQPAPATVEP